MDGVLIINKPAGFTSHDVVARVRRILGESSVGHLGTLDPSATGVLPLLTGRFTRLAQFYSDADKRYAGLIRFGLATNTYDAEGEPLGPPQPVTFSEAQLREAATRFVGRIEQTPPPFSAKKVQGVPAYKLARKNQEVHLKPKTVEIKEFEITGWNGTEAGFKAWVSSGTYIRTLAHELGKMLGPGAHLGELVRTGVREFTLAEAHSLDELERAAQGPTPDTTSDNRYYCLTGAGSEEDSRLGIPAANHFSGKEGGVVKKKILDLFIHPRLVLPEFPAVTADAQALGKIRHGSAVNLPEFGKAPLVRVFANQRDLVAIARRIAGTLFQPKIVLFNP